MIDTNPYSDSVSAPGLYDGMCEGIVRILQYRDRYLGSLTQDLKTCRTCKAKVPVQEMGVKEINVSNGYWEVGTSSVCGNCSESRSVGTKDEDGDHLAGSIQYKRRLRDGFWMLKMHGKFGEFHESEWDDSNDTTFPDIKEYLGGR